MLGDEESQAAVDGAERHQAPACSGLRQRQSRA
jgi:hypothetical protein